VTSALTRPVMAEGSAGYRAADSSSSPTGQSADDFAIPVTGNERHKGFAEDYLPRPGSDRARYMSAAEAVIGEYAAQGLRLTTRAHAYRTAAILGVGHEQLDNIEDAVVMLRRTGRVDIYAVEDGRTDWTRYWTVSAAEAAETLYGKLETLQADRQYGQPQRVVLMIEAAGMVPILAPLAQEYGVPVLSGSGSVPLTANHTIAVEAVNHYRKTGVTTVVLCVTDFDLKGIKGIFVPFARDVAAFAADYGYPGAVHVRRIAATPEQIEAHIPANLRIKGKPVEGTGANRRAVEWWPADFTLPAAEALVDVLPGIVRAAFDHHLPDADQRSAVVGTEAGRRDDAAAELRDLLEQRGGGA
jgi:hypothetical protein